MAFKFIAWWNIITFRLLKDNVGGIDSLDNNVLNYSTSLSDVFANHEQWFGMAKAIEDDDAMDALLCLNFSDLDLAEKVIELVSVSCWYSIEGYDRVTAAMERYQKFHQDPKPFFTMINSLEKIESLDFKMKVLQFINTIVNKSPDLVDRCVLRNDFHALGTMTSWLV